jgi:hypothetical protein
MSPTNFEKTNSPKIMDIYICMNIVMGAKFCSQKKKRKEKKSWATYMNSLKVLNLSECVGPHSQQAFTFRALML